MRDALIFNGASNLDFQEIRDKKEKDALYHELLIAGGPKAIMIKMADRLHNLRTLGARSRENQLKIVKETREEYFPLFESVSNTYFKETKYLISQMEIAIKNLHID